MEINVENREQIIALLREGICPICGKGAFKGSSRHGKAGERRGIYG